MAACKAEVYPKHFKAGDSPTKRCTRSEHWDGYCTQHYHMKAGIPTNKAAPIVGTDDRDKLIARLQGQLNYVVGKLHVVADKIEARHFHVAATVVSETLEELESKH